MNETLMMPRFANRIAYQLANLTGAKLKFYALQYRKGCEVHFSRDGEHSRNTVLKMTYLHLDGVEQGVLDLDYEGNRRTVSNERDAWDAIWKIITKYGSWDILTDAFYQPKGAKTGKHIFTDDATRQECMDRLTALKTADLSLIDHLFNHYREEFTSVGRGRGGFASERFSLMAEDAPNGDVVRAEMIEPTTLQISREACSQVYHFNTLEDCHDDVIAAVEQLAKVEKAFA